MAARSFSSPRPSPNAPVAVSSDVCSVEEKLLYGQRLPGCPHFVRRGHTKCKETLRRKVALLSFCYFCTWTHKLISATFRYFVLTLYSLCNHFVRGGVFAFLSSRFMLLCSHCVSFCVPQQLFSMVFVISESSHSTVPLEVLCSFVIFYLFLLFCVSLWLLCNVGGCFLPLSFLCGVYYRVLFLWICNKE